MYYSVYRCFSRRFQSLLQQVTVIHISNPQQWRRDIAHMQLAAQGIPASATCHLNNNTKCSSISYSSSMYTSKTYAEHFDEVVLHPVGSNIQAVRRRSRTTTHRWYYLICTIEGKSTACSLQIPSGQQHYHMDVLAKSVLHTCSSSWIITKGQK